MDRCRSGSHTIGAAPTGAIGRRQVAILRPTIQSCCSKRFGRAPGSTFPRATLSWIGSRSSATGRISFRTRRRSISFALDSVGPRFDPSAPKVTFPFQWRYEERILSLGVRFRLGGESSAAAPPPAYVPPPPPPPPAAAEPAPEPAPPPPPPPPPTAPERGS